MNAKAKTLEEELSRQSDMIDLADAWMEKTQGVIVPGVVIDREEYITRIQELPVWDKVKDDLGFYTSLLSKTKVKINKSEVKANFAALKFGLTIVDTINHFLSDPDYSVAENRPFGSPRPLNRILESYRTDLNNGSGGYELRRGNAIKVFYLLNNGIITEQDLLDVVGLRERWEAYQKTTGIPREYRELAKKILNHFLNDPDYYHDKLHSLGTPKTLKNILDSYRTDLENGEGGYQNNKGECQRIYGAIKQGLITEEELLDSIGLREQWEAYQKTTGIPREYRRKAKKVLEHFLSNVSYCTGDRWNKQDSPRKLKSVLEKYRTHINNVRGSFHNSKGEAHKVYDAIKRGLLKADDLLKSIGLYEAWQDYRKTTTGNPFVFDPKKYQKAA